MQVSEIRESKFVTGTNQTLKMIGKGAAETVFIAEDASPYLFSKIENACTEAGVSFETVAGMKELGNYCGISRNAVCAAIIK